ncbi:TNF receptor-associated factor 4-like [Halichondria panicea]|uniref:TNF receptor-associated factor 4-like n=1 Tax=Halichondria panicea TaxID=6063 RepID=UPI00312B62D3
MRRRQKTRTRMSTSRSQDNPTDLKSQSYSHQDGFEISFVEQPPKELPLKCSICLELLTDPCILDCDCGNNFCKVCIEKVKKNGYPCPLCQQKFTTILPNKQLQRTLNGLMIHCPHRADGCSWMDELSKLKKHINQMPSNETRLEGCGRTDVLCQYCKKFISRQYIPTHETKTCPKKPYTCQYCGLSSVLDDIREKHWLVCLHFPVPCPYECGKRLQRQSLELHMEKKCLLTPLQCGFRYAGCEVELPRQDMANHLRDSIVDHMTLMSLKHREDRKEVSALKEECADLKEENKRLQSQLAVVNSETQNLKFKVVKLEMQLDHQASAVVPPVQSSPRAPLVVPPVQPPSSKVPPVKLVVTDVKQLRLLRDDWTFEPFYSRGGYKMVLNVYPYGNQCGSGTHLSVFIRLVQGEYDQQLQWPFLGKVTVTLVDQRLGRHKTETLYYHSWSNCGARRFNTLTNAHGWDTFIEHKYLPPNYLKNDCLVFRIDDIKYTTSSDENWLF